MTSETPNQPSPEQARPPHAQEVKREIFEFAKMVVWFLVLFFALRTWVIEGYEVQGPSMEPNLQNGERILVLKLPHILSRHAPFRGINAIKPNDIVVFNSTDEANKRYVKRVVAQGPKATDHNIVGAAQEGGVVPLDSTVSVEIYEVTDDNDEVHFKVYVDNHPLDQSYLPGAESWSAIQERHSRPDYKETLTPGRYYVMGDNRTRSRDSRFFGPVNDDQIIGKAVLRFWPLNRIGLLR